MNAWIRADYVAAGLSDRLTEGSWLSGLLPETAVDRAFSPITRDRLVPAAAREPGVWAAGYVPVLVGALSESAPLDVGEILLPRMLTPGELTALLEGDKHGTADP